MVLENILYLQEVHMVKWGRWPVTRAQLRAEALGPASGKNVDFHRSTPSSPFSWYLDFSPVKGLAWVL